VERGPATQAEYSKKALYLKGREGTDKPGWLKVQGEDSRHAVGDRLSGAGGCDGVTEFGEESGPIPGEPQYLSVRAGSRTFLAMMHFKKGRACGLNTTPLESGAPEGLP
jgi:hypothetical protein